MSAPIGGSASPSNALPISLWVVQVLLAIVFVGTGFWKLLTPVPKLAAVIPWAGQVPAGFLYATGVIDLCGGLGIVLPSLTRIKPGLTVLAALGCAALQVSAIVFHFSRGEAANTPFNFLLVALSLFVFWGRRSRAPIQPQGATGQG
ncbi:DoxX family protein [Hyalangium versicolor]|uniref:DoxX family protein n=1 Tax=Hyalangium versicolor TaxID=2861190 RepID=UPI001CCF1761|nr:DoxX family protein [Hyalangium versicolor]